MVNYLHYAFMIKVRIPIPVTPIPDVQYSNGGNKMTTYSFYYQNTKPCVSGNQMAEPFDYQTLSPVFRCYLNTGVFTIQTINDPLSTGLVQNFDTHCISLFC